MASSYKADSIEVLEGLDPVRKRPGMYTDTTNPNHLVQEVIDNSVDEALEGFADEIRVTLRKSGVFTESELDASLTLRSCTLKPYYLQVECLLGSKTMVSVPIPIGSKRMKPTSMEDSSKTVHP